VARGPKVAPKLQKVALDLSKNKNENIYEKLQKISFTGYKNTEIIVATYNCKLYYFEIYK